MKVVLDTNVLLVSIPKKSKYRIILDALLSNKFTLYISNEILIEYEEIISRKTNLVVSKNVVEMINSLKNVEKKEIYYRWNLIQIDKDDNKFVDVAIAGNVDFIVSNDKHFKVLNKIRFPSLNVISIDQFVKLLKTS